jgi:PTH1 family peptidyl-tRNA hydrolase
MKLVIGLGNPGAEYERTRHNVGYRVLDKLAAKLGWSWNERRARAVLASGNIGGEKVILAKPITFMNLSGESVGELARWYKVSPQDILVVYDELDLPPGKLRLRPSGSAAGHNGLDNIIRHLHTNAFPRLRVGIGNTSNNHLKGKNYVLGIPPLDDRILIEQGEDSAVDAILQAIQQGIGTTMNEVNADPEEMQRKIEEQQRKKREREERLRLKREAEEAERQAKQAQDSLQQQDVKEGTKGDREGRPYNDYGSDQASASL